MSRENRKKPTPDATSTPSSRRSGLKQMASASLLIVALFAIYAIGVTNRLEETEQHSLRILAQMGDSVESVIAKSIQVVDSLSKLDYACEFFGQQSRLTPDRQTGCKELETFIRQGEKFNPDSLEKCQDTEDPGAVETTLDFDKFLESSQSGFAIGLKFNRVLRRYRKDESLKTIECDEKPESKSLSLHLDLDEVLDATSFGSAFQAILIADDQAQVISQHTPSGHALFEPPGQHLDHESASFAVGSLAQLMSVKSKSGEPIAISLPTKTTSVDRVRLAGARYTLMCQPLVLDYPAAAYTTKDTTKDASQDTTSGATQNVAVAPSKAYRICGLIDGGHSLRRSLEIASPLVIGMFAFVLLGILAWPIVKLTTLRPRERMRFVEVYVAMLATIAVLMVGTVLLLSTDRAFMGNDGSRARLAHMAVSLETNLKDEFRQARAQLHVFDTALPDVVEQWMDVCAQRDADEEKGPCKGDRPNWLKTRILENWASSDGIDFPLPAAYPYLSQVFWMRLDTGMQVLKATARTANTPAVRVDSREYYKAVANETLWDVEAADTNNEKNDAIENDNKYFVQSFRSLTTGAFSAALSTRSDHACSENSGKTSDGDASPVCKLREEDRAKEGETKDFDLGIVLSFEPLSLVNPILAPGVSFAVVDNHTGTTVFHSDVRHATVENLFDDEGISDRLRAAIQSKATVDFDGRYRTRPHRIHVNHVENIPWTIVMFEDAEITRTSSVEVLSRATLMIAVHLSVLGLLTGIYLSINGRETPAWIWPTAHWPHEDRIRFYRGGCWWLVAWGLATMTAIFLLNGTGLRWAIAVPQLIIVIFLFAGAVRAASHKIVRRFERLGQWALIATLVTCAVLSTIFDHNLADPPLVAAAFVAALVLTLIGTRLKHIHIGGITRWIIIAAALVAICMIGIFDSLFWAGWCLIAFFACYLMMPLDSWNHRLRGYQLMSMLVWLVIAVPPAVGYFKIAHERELLILKALEEDYTGRADVYRQNELKQQFKDHPGAATFYAQRTGQKPLVKRPADCKESDLMSCANGAFAVSDIGRLSYLPYVRASERKDEKYGANSVCGQSDGAVDKLCTSLGETIDRHFPIYNEMTSYGRYRRVPSNGDGQQALARISLPFGSAIFLGSIISLGLLWAWVAYGARRLFYGEIGARTAPLTVAQIVSHSIERHTIATLATRAQYAFVDRHSDTHDVFNLSQEVSLHELERRDCDGPVLCTHLGDALRDDRLRVRVLALLEKLARCRQGDVLVLTGVPIAQTQSSVSPADESAHMDGRVVAFPFENDGESARWRDILAHFESVDVSIRGSIEAPMASKASLSQLPDKDWLDVELGAMSDLASLMGPDYERALTEPLTRREVIKEIGKRADWFYRSLWDNCTTDEKLVLTQLSREGVVNPRQVNAVRSLLARGLLRMDPVLKPVNNSFGRFVASMFDADEVSQLELAGRKQGFNKRRILMSLILVVMLFLWFTQRDVVETWITYVGAIAVGMTGVLKIMDSLKGGAAQR